MHLICTYNKGNYLKYWNFSWRTLCGGLVCGGD